MKKSEAKQSNSLFSYLKGEGGESSLVIVLLVVVAVTGMVMAQNNRTDFVRLKANHRADAEKGLRANTNALTVAKAMLNYLNPPTSNSWKLYATENWEDMPAFFPDPYYREKDTPFTVKAINYVPSTEENSLWSFEQGKFFIDDFSSSLAGKKVTSAVSFDGVHYDDPDNPNLITSMDLTSDTNINIRGHGDKNYKNEATIALPKPPPAICYVMLVNDPPEPTNYDCDWCVAPPAGYDLYVDEGVTVALSLRVSSVILSASMEGKKLRLPYPETASVGNKYTYLAASNFGGQGRLIVSGEATGPINSCSDSYSVWFVPPPGEKPGTEEEILALKSEKERILGERAAARAAYLKKINKYYDDLRKKTAREIAKRKERDKYRKNPPRSIQKKWKK